MNRWTLRLLPLLFFATSLVCRAQPAPVPEGADDAGVYSHRTAGVESLAVLFIGNSLTYANNLPAIFEAFLISAGIEAAVEAIAYSNYGLEDHWASRKTRRAIDEGDWDVVVMQQGPSATEGRPSLLEYSKRFSEHIRAADAEPALYMVWPARSRSFDFDGVSDSYKAAAEAAGGILLPVGEAWRVAWKRDPQLALYGPDGFHPSVAGSYLAAAVMFRCLTSRDPRGLPAQLELRSKRRAPFSLRPELATRLQEAAAAGTSCSQP